MTLVSRAIFLDMFDKKVLSGSKEADKRWSITKNQKHLVGDDAWEQYQNLLQAINKANQN